MDPRVIVVILSVLFLSDLISAEEEYPEKTPTEQIIEVVEFSGTCVEGVQPFLEYFQELKTDADKGNELKLMEVLKEVEIKDQLINTLNATIKSKDEQIQTLIKNNDALMRAKSDDKDQEMISILKSKINEKNKELKKISEDKDEVNRKLHSCLDNVIKNYQSLVEKDKEIQEKTDQAKTRDVQNSLLTSRINDLSQNLTKANKRLLECDEIKSEVNNKLHSCLDNLIKNNRTLIEKDKEIQEKADQAKIRDAQNSLLTSQLNDLSQNLTKANKRLLEYDETNSCTTAEKGIYNIKLPGMCAFKAPCNGSGWTVIQRRMDGSVDFNRNWTEYRDGFGNLNGEFFIGLEKLYQITQSSQYELLISLGKVDGSRDFIKYDNFKIGSEKNSYRLESIGRPTAGGAGDYLIYNLNNKFSTYDRDNDYTIKSCATEHGGGWWFGACGYSSLNGRFYKDGKIKNRLYGITWGMWAKYDYTVSLTFVEMMIRPKTF